MKRKSKHILKFSNKNKINTLQNIYNDCKQQIEIYINKILKKELKINKLYISSKLLSSEFIEQSHWKQICFKQASEIVKSQIKFSANKRFKNYQKLYTRLKKANRYNKFTSKKFSELNLNYVEHTKYFTKPLIKKLYLNLDDRVLDFKYNQNTFDCFINLTTPYKKSQYKYKNINIPIKFHKQSNKYLHSGWKQKNYVGFNECNNNLYFDLLWEKEMSVKPKNGKTIGLDCGFKKLLISSDNITYDVGLENIYHKISRKKQGSKNFKQVLRERDNLINKSINQIKTDTLSTIVVEDLKNVKLKSNFSKKFNNKLQRWSYPKVLNKLSMICEEYGINLIKVEPAYTSQTCSKCGSIHKESRKGEKFKCVDCGYEIDADYNASINILHRGVYNLSAKESINKNKNKEV